MTIIRIQDLVDSRALKSRELAFYNQRLEELNYRLSIVQREIAVTQFIINAIEQEQIVDFKEFTK
jgi:hypothetical protein